MRRIWILALVAFVGAAAWGNGKEEQPAPMMEAEPMMEASMDMEAYGESPVPPPTAMDGEYAKPSENELKKKLTPLQFSVTQNDGTEPAWNNIYWDNKKDGIYVDIVSGEPLFSSKDKYDSRTGWPSFTRPLHDGNIVEKKDTTYGMVRVEVRSFYGDSHLGHVFNDGPAPTGLRYCMNSASLRFVPVENLESEGYGEYLSLFETK